MALINPDIKSIAKSEGMGLALLRQHAASVITFTPEMALYASEVSFLQELGTLAS